MKSEKASHKPVRRQPGQLGAQQEARQMDGDVREDLVEHGLAVAGKVRDARVRGGGRRVEQRVDERRVRAEPADRRSGVVGRKVAAALELCVRKSVRGRSGTGI